MADRERASSHTVPRMCLERVTRIELALSAWEADVLPLNYTRMYALTCRFPERGRCGSRSDGQSEGARGLRCAGAGPAAAAVPPEPCTAALEHSRSCCCPTATSPPRSPRGGSASDPTTQGGER